MSFMKVQHQHAAPPMPSPASTVSSYDGDVIRASGHDLVKRLLGDDEILAQMVLQTPLLLLIGLLIWSALLDRRSQY